MASPGPLLAPGAVVAGDFEVEAALGEGGMGAVFSARQRSTGRRRALKVMHPHLASDPALRARFEREARLVAKVDSPNVVEVIAAGVDAATGVPWIAMELLLGEDLGARLARGPLSLEETSLVIGQVGHALAAAHRVGVVHRDLKPENVFLDASRLRAGEPFRVKVLDFGVALLREAGKAKGATQAIGSPLWMSPEQAEPGDRVGPAADVWALGLLAFGALTGRPFWREGNRADAPLQALLREVLFDPIPTPSARARQFGLAPPPRGFDAWFARAVVRDPAARFPSIEEAVAAFHEAVGRPRPAVVKPIPPTLVWPSPASPPPRVVGAAPVPAPSAPPRRATRSRFALAALAVVALAGGGLASARALKPEPPRSAPRAVATTAPAPAVAASPAPEPEEPAPGTRPPTAMRAMDLPTRSNPLRLDPDPVARAARPARPPRQSPPTAEPASAEDRAPPADTPPPSGANTERARAVDALRRALSRVTSEEDKQRILRQIEALGAP